MKDFSQTKGIDFDEILSPIVKFSSIITILGLVANQDLEIEQMILKLLFSMVNWKNKYTCSNYKGLKSKKKKT